MLKGLSRILSLHRLITTTFLSQSNNYIIRNNIGYFCTSANTFNLIQNKENKLQIISLKDLFVDFLNVSPSEYRIIIDSNKNISQLNHFQVHKALKICLDLEIIRDVILKNLWLLEMEPSLLKEKTKLILKMHFTNVNHGVPYLKLTTKRLQKLCILIQQDQTNTLNRNRLYYVSEKLKMDPYFVAEYISKRLFIYSLPFEILKTSLSTLLEMGIKNENILKDLWVLQYNTATIKERLSKFKHIGREKMMPWMVKCTEPVRERAMSITVLEKELLGDTKSALNYLAVRLNCNSNVVNDMAEKTPCILTARVSKIRNTVDFLFEEGFNEKDIILVPRVFAHSQNTLQRRLNKLSSMGERPKNLNTICRSQKDFSIYLKNLLPRIKAKSKIR